MLQTRFLVIAATSRCRRIGIFSAAILLLVGFPFLVSGPSAHGQDFQGAMFRDENLVAWCIVPFDSQKRTPEQRAAMLDELGIRKLAYDYRAEHVPSFDEEITTMKKHGIEFTAWWFPTVLNDEAKHILSLIKKHEIHPQLWVMGGGDPAMNEEQTKAFIESEVKRIREIAKAAQDAGCKVALYNHGAWFGTPENQVRLIKAVDMPNVGIVYNLHHAHDQLDRLPSILKTIQPYLLAINLNGMQTDGERRGKKILPIGQGDRDREVIQLIGKSGFQGPVGILNHTDLDAKVRLKENLDGLRAVAKEVAASQP
ncbi:MAG: sugar phosphate isomerase/epimerase family protein [Pirellula sp.]|jgi:sugar phosphate isomerase/epimerase